MKKIVCLLLVLTLLCLPGCSQPKDALQGTWQATVDVTALAHSALSGMESTIGTVTLRPIAMSVTLVIGEDRYTATIDETALAQAYEGLLEDVRAGVEQLYAEKAKQQSLNVEEYLAMAGTSMDQVMASIKEQLDDADITGQLTALFTGTGTVDASETILALEGLFNCEYLLDGDVLTLNRTIGDQESIAFTKA